MKCAYSREQLSVILSEISDFSIDLVEDPTLPSLGGAYLKKQVGICRGYLNRVIYYVQIVGKQVKDLSIEVRQRELDLELKMAQKLADDPVVKQQPSIEDRRALALVSLKAEHDYLSELKLELLDAQETLKIIKMKHQDLLRTNSDIKLQWQLVKEDMSNQLAGGQGYSKPQAGQDRAIPGGMLPPVSPGKIDPQDLLDPEKRPDDMPEPIDEMHALQLSEFFRAEKTADQSAPVQEASVQEASPRKIIDIDL